MKPGEQGIVKINFHSTELLGEINNGSTFQFYEGPVLIGKGSVTEGVEWIDN